ncbi:hypothetical protein EDB85DRAFT_2140650 [Lactarius pseudohatsudake]|nr:hypothetical protein EDB85DRAFT_2140650 [Lactarius pseudohatsudake]
MPVSQAQIRCRGCNRVFTYRGLSQHINRTQLPSCRALRATIQLPTTCQAQGGSNLASNTGPTSWDHGEFANHGDTTGTAGCEDIAAECEDAAAKYKDAATEREDTTANQADSDPADIIDADLLELLVQDFDCRIDPDQGLSTSSDQLDQPHTSGSPPSDLAQPLLHSEPSDSNGSQLVVDRFPHGSPGAPIPGTLQGSHM